ncbi:MAG TPA: DinB family protein [Gemmatimonadales bacterium]|nr:DinB family protein [Gemmatimonadales bacterium]
MPIKESMLPEFDHEMASTRRVLERVPEKRASWQPHPKSKSLGELAEHLAGVPGWVASIIDAPSCDVAPPEGRSASPPTFESSAELLRRFDRNVAAARAALAGRSDADLMTPWTLKRGGQDLLTMPRAGVFRTLLLNHMIHHRGQLTVYLRLNDVPLPIVYGQTADERW